MRRGYNFRVARFCVFLAVWLQGAPAGAALREVLIYREPLPAPDALLRSNAAVLLDPGDDFARVHDVLSLPDAVLQRGFERLDEEALADVRFEAVPLWLSGPLVVARRKERVALIPSPRPGAAARMVRVAAPRTAEDAWSVPLAAELGRVAADLHAAMRRDEKRAGPLLSRAFDLLAVGGMTEGVEPDLSVLGPSGEARRRLDGHLADCKAALKAIKADPEGFRARALSRRPGGADSLSLEVRPFLAYVRDSLEIFGDELGLKGRRRFAAVLEPLRREAERSLRRPVPKHVLTRLALRFAKAGTMLSWYFYGDRDAAEHYFHNEFKEPPAHETHREFDDEILLPVPFMLGFETLNRLWIRDIFPIGVIAAAMFPYGSHLASGDGVGRFAFHDYTHWRYRTTSSSSENLALRDRAELEERFRAQTRQADLARFGLSQEDQGHFLHAVELVVWDAVHERGIPFGRQIRASARALSLSDLPAGGPKALFGSRWAAVLEAAVAWSNEFWREHRVPSLSFPRFEEN